MTYDESLDLILTRELKAPCEKLWRAWTEPELLIQWWSPRPWTTKVKHLDLHPGGAFELVMISPDGEHHASPGAFLHIEQGRSIVFTSALQSGWRPVHKPFLPMTATITMEDHENGSRYTAHVQHDGKETRDKHEEMGFFDGWGTCISQLEELAQTLEDA